MLTGCYLDSRQGTGSESHRTGFEEAGGTASATVGWYAHRGLLCDMCLRNLRAKGSGSSPMAVRQEEHVLHQDPATQPSGVGKAGPDAA